MYRPFADAVRAGAGAVMCSYNQVCFIDFSQVFALTIWQINNSYGSQNSYTLNYLLKNELDFQGFGKNSGVRVAFRSDTFQ